MNRYKDLFDRVPENPEAERMALAAPHTVKTARPAVRFAGIAAACCMLVALGALAWPRLFGTDGLGTPGSAGTEEWDIPPTTLLSIPAIDELRGLAAEPFTIGNDITLGWFDLFDAYASPNSFKGITIAYVLDVRTANSGAEEAYVQVLHSAGGQLPGELTVVSDEPLLRIGGVYILSLGQQPEDGGSDIYSVLGDDCLFEIDANGFIASHSNSQDFSVYDGQAVAVLWDEIVYLADHPALVSALAGNMRYEVGELAPNRFVSAEPETRVVVRAVVKETDGYTNTEINVHEDLYNPGQLEADISLDGHNGFGLSDPLEAGKEYIFIGTVGTPFYYAEVDESGVLHIPDDYPGNAMAFAEGMTVNDLRGVIDEICEYYGLTQNENTGSFSYEYLDDEFTHLQTEEEILALTYEMAYEMAKEWNNPEVYSRGRAQKTTDSLQQFIDEHEFRLEAMRSLARFHLVHHMTYEREQWRNHTDELELPWFDGTNADAPVVRYKAEDAPEEVQDWLTRPKYDGGSDVFTSYDEQGNEVLRQWTYYALSNTDHPIGYSEETIDGKHHVYLFELDEVQPQEDNYVIVSVALGDNVYGNSASEVYARFIDGFGGSFSHSRKVP